MRQAQDWPAGPSFARSKEAGLPDDVLDNMELGFPISQLTRLGTPGSHEELSGAIRIQDEEGRERGEKPASLCGVSCLLQTPRDVLQQGVLKAGLLRGVRERQEAVVPRAHLGSCSVLHTPGKQLPDTWGLGHATRISGLEEDYRSQGASCNMLC